MGDTIEASLAVPGGEWRVVIEGGDTTVIAMRDNVLHITVAEIDRDELADPEVEGVYFGTDEPTPLRYYIEKDFPCAHPRPPAANDPVTETFAPPADFKQRHKTDCL